ncbi:hypothetical protein EP7_000980 [Isosphaeraceae bacterium EP7]
MDDAKNPPLTLAAWKADQVALTMAFASRKRLGLAFMAMGWAHLGCFLLLQALYNRGFRQPPLYIGIWVAELGANLWLMRQFSGPGWAKSTAILSLLVRIWGTFLLLSFTLVSLNHLMTFSMEWYRSAWTTLSTFGFAMTAYLTTPWFFVPAVQMYFTGLLLAMYPRIGFVAYGVSWWAALQGIGLVLEYKRARSMAPEASTAGLLRAGRPGIDPDSTPSHAKGRWPAHAEGLS